MAYPTVEQLVGMTDAELERVDPAVMNLVIASGIPAFGNLNIGHYVRVIDDWAHEIQHDIDRHAYRFERNPAEFDHSLARYKIGWIVSDFYTVFKIDYDVLDADFRDPSNLFLNGIVDRKLGTCVSLPILHVALGWRLKMPIKLISVPTHLFARYDDGKERINIEATGYGDSLPDEQYEAEYFVSPRCKQSGAYLTSLTARQALAQMLSARASYWQAKGDVHRFVEDSLRANLLFPSDPLAITNLSVAWTARSKKDDYFDHARTSLADAAKRLEQRRTVDAERPIEKLIFDEQQRAVRVLVDPRTGSMTPVEGDK